MQLKLFVMLIKIWNAHNQHTLTKPLLQIISHNSIFKTSNNHKNCLHFRLSFQKYFFHLYNRISIKNMMFLYFSFIVSRSSADIASR